MSKDNSALKNKHPKVQLGHYLPNPNEPSDDVMNDSPIKSETKLSENSPNMRQQLRSIATRLRNRPSQLLKPASEVTTNYIQANEEQLRREHYYIEFAKVDDAEMAVLNKKISRLKEKFNTKRHLLGLPPIISPK